VTPPFGGSPGGGPSQGPGIPSAARGAALLGLAVIVAIIGLQILDDSSPSTSNAGTTTTTTNVGPTTTSGFGTSTTTSSGATTTTTRGGTTTTKSASAGRPTSQVKVIVINVSGVQGAAQTLTNTLKSLGYNTSVPTNGTTQQTGSTVGCEAGFEKEAQVLAFVGVDHGAKVVAYPTSIPSGVNGEDCIVFLGKTT